MQVVPRDGSQHGGQGVLGYCADEQCTDIPALQVVSASGNEYEEEKGVVGRRGEETCQWHRKKREGNGRREHALIQ